MLPNAYNPRDPAGGSGIHPLPSSLNPSLAGAKAMSRSGGLQLPAAIGGPPMGAHGYTPPKRAPARLDALPAALPLGGRQLDQGSATASAKPKREKRRARLDDPRVVRLMSEVTDELAKLSSAVPGGMGTERPPTSDLAPFLQEILSQLRDTRGRLGSVWIDSAQPAGTPPARQEKADNGAEMKEMVAKMAKLEQENAKMRRYATRAKTAVEKLQAERKRMAADLATADFKLKEALAGRGNDAAKLLEDGRKNEKTEKMKEWEKKHGQNQDEAQLRARFEEEQANIMKMRTPEKSAGGEGGEEDEAPPPFVMQNCNQ